jgi:hypothetical protein
MTSHQPVDVAVKRSFVHHPSFDLNLVGLILEFNKQPACLPIDISNDTQKILPFGKGSFV